jgi:hypothetical protein
MYRARQFTVSRLVVGVMPVPMTAFGLILPFLYFILFFHRIILSHMKPCVSRTRDRLQTGNEGMREFTFAPTHFPLSPHHQDILLQV